MRPQRKNAQFDLKAKSWYATGLAYRNKPNQLKKSKDVQIWSEIPLLSQSLCLRSLSMSFYELFSTFLLCEVDVCL